MAETNIIVGAAALLFLFLLVLVFWIWALVDMLRSRRLKTRTKVVLFILFFVASILTAIVWVVVRRRV